MSTSAFFDAVRPLFGGKLKQEQVDGLEALLAATVSLPISYRAYLLATTQHETANTMQPIYEYGPKSYFNKYEPGTKLGKTLGNTQSGDGYRFRGTGYVMLTGRANFKRAGQNLGLDLVANPELAVRPDVAAKILVTGCVQGWFTGRKLGDYLDGAAPDYVNARRVVNGTDKAAHIASLAKSYEAALRKLGQTSPEPVSGQSAFEVAKSHLGKHEVKDRNSLMTFLAASGTKVDPKTTAWCAAFVNAALGSVGQTGTGSLMARSFLQWGVPTDEPKRGDVVVFERGKAPFGHVAFFDSVNADGTLRVLGGNQSDSVCWANYDSSKVLGYRKSEVAPTPSLPIDIPAVTEPDPETDSGSKTGPLAAILRLLASIFRK